MNLIFLRVVNTKCNLKILFTLFSKEFCIWKEGAKTRIMTIYGEQTVITWSTLKQSCSSSSPRESLMDEIALITVLPEEERTEKCVGLFMISVTEMETVSHILSKVSSS